MAAHSPLVLETLNSIPRHSGGVGTVSLIFLCSLTPVLAFTVPMAVLVGVLIGLGRLSADSEIVALHASGISLRRLLHNTHSERALICMFLAMLELVRLQAVLLHQPRQLGDILIKKTEEFDQVFADQTQTRDDWR